MLQKLALLFFGLVLYVTGATAQETKMPMRMIADCYTGIIEFRTYLKEELGEIGFTSAPGVFRRFDGQYGVGLFRTYLSPETYTYTLTVEFLNDNVVCVIAMGDEFAPVIQDAGDPL